MTQAKMVIWGMSIVDPSNEDNTALRWYHTDGIVWRWTAFKREATPINVEDAIMLMRIHDRVGEDSTFTLQFIS